MKTFFVINFKTWLEKNGSTLRSSVEHISFYFTWSNINNSLLRRSSPAKRNKSSAFWVNKFIFKSTYLQIDGTLLHISRGLWQAIFSQFDFSFVVAHPVVAVVLRHFVLPRVRSPREAGGPRRWPNDLFAETRNICVNSSRRKCAWWWRSRGWWTLWRSLSGLSVKSRNNSSIYSAKHFCTYC